MIPLQPQPRLALLLIVSIVLLGSPVVKMALRRYRTMMMTQRVKEVEVEV